MQSNLSPNGSLITRVTILVIGASGGFKILNCTGDLFLSMYLSKFLMGVQLHSSVVVMDPFDQLEQLQDG